MANALNWFEIPATDIDRAKKFYNRIFEIELIPIEASSGFPMVMFPAERGDISGAVIQGEGYKPSVEGSIVYLNCGDDLNTVLNRIEAAGGRVVMSKTDISENGFVAYFMDSEGNKVGLHSMG